MMWFCIITALLLVGNLIIMSNKDNKNGIFSSGI
jgi:hypothetical protein